MRLVPMSSECALVRRKNTAVEQLISVFLPRELFIPPGESRTIRVYFDPQDVSERQKGQIAFFNMDDLSKEDEAQELEAIQQDFAEEERNLVPVMGDEGGVVDDRIATPLSRATTAHGSRPITAVANISGDVSVPKPPARVGSPRTRKITGHEPKIVTTIDLEGVGGEFGFTAGVADDNGAVVPGASIEGRPGTAVASTIKLNFPKVGEDARVRKHFEVENCGNTMIELGVFDKLGNAVSEDVGGESDKGGVGWKVTPTRIEIKPKTRQRFTVVVKAGSCNASGLAI